MSIQHFQTKLGITKYSIVTNSNDSVTLRLMTEHDLAMLYEWLNRSHIVEWWGGGEKHARHLLTCKRYLPSVLAQESVTPYIAMLNGEPIRYAQSRCSWKRGRMVGRRNRPGVRGIDQSLANASQLGKGWEPSWFELWLSCCSMIPRSPKIQTDPSPSNLRAIDATRKSGV